MKTILLTCLVMLAVSVCLAGETETGVYFTDRSFQAGNPILHRLYYQSYWISMGDNKKIPMEKVRGFTDAQGFHLKYDIAQGRYGFATRVREGRISVYEKSESRYGGGATKPQTQLYFTYGDDNLYKLNYNNLYSVVNANPICRRYMDKHIASNAVTFVSAIALGIVIYVFMNDPGKENGHLEDYDTMIVPGGIAAMLAISGLVKAPTYLKKAVDEFNK